jgi:hypothetical protein
MDEAMAPDGSIGLIPDLVIRGSAMAVRPGAKAMPARGVLR